MFCLSPISGFSQSRSTSRFCWDVAAKDFKKIKKIKEYRVFVCWYGDWTDDWPFFFNGILLQFALCFVLLWGYLFSYCHSFYYFKLFIWSTLFFNSHCALFRCEHNTCFRIVVCFIISNYLGTSAILYSLAGWTFSTGIVLLYTSMPRFRLCN